MTCRKGQFTYRCMDILNTIPNDPRQSVFRNKRVISQVFYDSLTRLTAEIDSLNNAPTYEYDAVGNKTKVTDARTIDCLRIWPLNRLLKVIDAWKTKPPSLWRQR
jgi:YD repeat-containing protein